MPPFPFLVLDKEEVEEFHRHPSTDAGNEIWRCQDKRHMFGVQASQAWKRCTFSVLQSATGYRASTVSPFPSSNEGYQRCSERDQCVTNFQIFYVYSIHIIYVHMIFICSTYIHIIYRLWKNTYTKKNIYIYIQIHNILYICIYI